MQPGNAKDTDGSEVQIQECGRIHNFQGLKKRLSCSCRLVFESGEKLLCLGEDSSICKGNPEADSFNDPQNN